MDFIKHIADAEISLDKLFASHMPEFVGYKDTVFRKAFEKFGAGLAEKKTLAVSKFSCSSLKDIAIGKEWAGTEIVNVDRHFDYSDVSDSLHKSWYMNFADPLLFGFYDSDMFGQDEIQVFEHPALASVREWLDSEKIPGLKTFTFRNGEPTPMTFENVPKWIDVNTREYPVYGWRFGQACMSNDFGLLSSAIKISGDEKVNNILAVAAPSGRKGKYRKNEIKEALKACVVGFGGAVSLSVDSSGNGTGCWIHSGRWGAGAFGGNEELLLAIQILSAKIAGVEKLYLHSVTDSCLKNALAVVSEIESSEIGNLDEACDFLVGKRYVWGVGDGN